LGKSHHRHRTTHKEVTTPGRCSKKRGNRRKERFAVIKKFSREKKAAHGRMCATITEPKPPECVREKVGLGGRLGRKKTSSQTKKGDAVGRRA